MGRFILGCLVSLSSAASQGAELPASTYGQHLIDDLARSNPQLLAAAIHVTPPKTSDSVVVASTDRGELRRKSDAADLAVLKGGTASAVSQAGDRLTVRLPLHDVSNDVIGSLSLTFAYRAGSDRNALEHSAEQIRDALHHRISNAGNLMDPYPYDRDAPSGNTHAQQLVDEFLQKYPDIEILAIHATAPDSDYNVIVGSNIGRIGKKADNDDMRAIYTLKPNLEVNEGGNRFESETPLRDRSGKVVGALGVVYAYKPGDDKQALHARAEQVNAELQKRIADAASLFQPAK